jgi:uncharacterized protein YecA (UPF0149 family)
MKTKIGRNDLCPCGSGKKFKKCCMEMDNTSNLSSWQSSEGIHVIGQGEKPSSEKLDEITKKYQEQIRKSPLWLEMVKKYGEEKAEELLTQFEVKSSE